MFASFLKIAVRNILKNRIFSFINVIGLAIGITGSLLIFVYVADQLSYESMHEKASHLYRASVEFGAGTSSIRLAGAFPALGPAAAAEIADVSAAVRLRNEANAIITIGNRQFKEEHFFFADSNVFSVFTFPLLAGDRNSVLGNPSSIVVSESIAKKYFGDGDPIGKSLVYNGKYEFTVAGIMKDVGANTMVRCELIAPYSRAEAISRLTQPWAQWGDDFTYLYVRDGASIPRLTRQLHDLFQRHTDPVTAAKVGITLMPIKDIHFKSDMMGELAPTGNLTSIYLFSSIAFLLLVIACLNFINLSTARSLRRSKEVGLRKVLGAHRSWLMVQFFGESFFVTFLAVITSFILYELLDPVLSSNLDLPLSASSFLSFNFLGILLAIVLFVGIVAGLYPAIFLSRFQPVDSLRGGRAPGAAGSRLRKLLVTLQFAISVFLIIGTLVIRQQIHFMQNTDLGFVKKNVLIINYPVSDNLPARTYLLIKQAFQSVPGVSDISGAYTLPGVNSKETMSMHLKGTNDQDHLMLQAIAADYDFIQTLGVQLLEGRNFSREHGSDSSGSIIINETARATLGLPNPVGTEVYLPAGRGRQAPATIIGVVKDFHVSSFHKKIEPLFLYINREPAYRIALKFDSRNTESVIAALRSEWKRILPDREFDFQPLDQKYDSLYRSDEKTSSLFTIFSLLSVFVACMGLVGLVSYSLELRTKEIGIRKVLGADVTSISALLSKDFVKWILISNLLAWPAAYLAVSRWLDDFAYRTQVGIGGFILASSSAILIALAAISYHAVRAARRNPVEALRNE